MKKRTRGLLVLFLVLSLLPIQMFYTGIPKGSDRGSWNWWKVKYVTYYPDRHVFIDRSLQHENWVIFGPAEERKKLWEVIYPEGIVFGIITKVVSNSIFDGSEKPDISSFISFLIQRIEVFEDVQLKARYWLLRQVLVPCRLLEAYGKPQVTRAP